MSETRTSVSLWRRRWFWVSGGLLVVAAATTALAAPRALAFRGPAGRGVFRSQMLHDPAAAKRHAGLALEWALRGVDATPQQRDEAKRIAERLIDDLRPTVEAHRAHREAMARELGKPQIDRQALERLRCEEIGLADQASQKAVVALADLAEVLTPEQRTEILDFARRLHEEPQPID